MASVEGLQEVTWETSKDGGRFLRTPRDQALVVTRDVDVHQIEIHLIETSKHQDGCTLVFAHTLGEGVDWTKNYEELTPAMFRDVEEMLLERESQIALLAVMPTGPKRSSMGLLFAQEEVARTAALVAHTALWDDAKLRFPIWAHHALQAGWTAPEGWRP